MIQTKVRLVRFVNPVFTITVNESHQLTFHTFSLRKVGFVANILAICVVGRDRAAVLDSVNISTLTHKTSHIESKGTPVRPRLSPCEMDPGLKSLFGSLKAFLGFWVAFLCATVCNTLLPCEFLKHNFFFRYLVTDAMVELRLKIVQLLFHRGPARIMDAVIVMFQNATFNFFGYFKEIFVIVTLFHFTPLLSGKRPLDYLSPSMSYVAVIFTSPSFIRFLLPISRCWGAFYVPSVAEALPLKIWYRFPHALSRRTGWFLCAKPGRRHRRAQWTTM